MTAPLSFTVLTLFPDMFPGPLGLSLAGKGLENGNWQLEKLDIREFSSDKHRTVDDTPFGGGAGMVMRPDVLDAALRQAEQKAGLGARKIYLSPRGRPLDQALVKELAAADHIILLCGRYEGVDQRVLDAHQMDEISLGDFVLSGGELAALALMDACIRLLPGVMGNTETVEEESFEDGLLEYPHYTRPADWQGRTVPEVLLSGHHARIRAWRQDQAERITKERRPDLWVQYQKKRSERVEEAS
jgi:tRNA (guanine37-N1)-methyltransferase